MNATPETQIAEHECILPLYARITGIVLISIIIVLGAVGNIAVCIILRVFKNRFDSVSHLFVINVAISDLLTSLTVVPFDVVYWTSFPVFPLSPSICRLWNALYFAFLAASSIGVSLIGVDIFLAVTKPLRYHVIVTKTKAYWILGISWLWSLAVGVLIYIFQEEPPQNAYLFELNTVAYGCYLIVHIALPSFVIPALYAKLFFIARGHARKVEPSGPALTDVNRAKLTVKRQLSMAKTFLFITIVFFLCWYPFFIVQMFYVFQWEKYVDWCKLETTDTVVCWFGYVQCCINPILYVFRRKNTRRIIFGQCRKPQQTGIFSVRKTMNTATGSPIKNATIME